MSSQAAVIRETGRWSRTSRRTSRSLLQRSLGNSLRPPVQRRRRFSRLLQSWLRV